MTTECPKCGSTYDDMIVTQLVENGKEIYCFTCEEFKIIKYTEKVE